MNDYFPACIIKPHPTVGNSAQYPGNILLSFKNICVIRIIRSPNDEIKFLIKLVFKLKLQYPIMPPTDICQNLQNG